MIKVKKLYYFLSLIIMGSSAMAATNCNQYNDAATIQNCRNLQAATEFGKQNMLSNFNNAMATQQNSNTTVAPIAGPQRSPTYILPNAVPPTPTQNPPPTINRPVRNYY